MSSLKGDGASTREQTQAGGWEPPGVERDQADWDHLPTHSTPLVKRKTFPPSREHSGEVTVRSAGQGRVTTTSGKPKSRSDVVISGASPQKRGTDLEEKGTNEKSSQLKEVEEEILKGSQESGTPDSEEEPKAREKVTKRRHLRRNRKPQKGIKRYMNKGKKEGKVKTKLWTNGVKRGYKLSLNLMKKKPRNWKEKCRRREDTSSNYGRQREKKHFWRKKDNLGDKLGTRGP